MVKCLNWVKTIAMETWQTASRRMTHSIQFVTFIDFLKTILLFLPEPFRASHPLPSPWISLRTAHGAFYFINSHLHSCSATQWIHYFLSPLTACSSFWLFFTFPTTHTFYNKGKPTKCLTNKILPLLFYPNRACFSRCSILVLWYFFKDGN